MTDASSKLLRQILLLALSSDQPGEAASALGKFREPAEAQGLDIHQLADRLSGIASTSRSNATPNFDDVEACDLASWALQTHRDRDRLRPNEIDFLHTIQGWVGDPTERQANWLAAIVARLRRAGQ